MISIGICNSHYTQVLNTPLNLNFFQLLLMDIPSFILMGKKNFVKSYVDFFEIEEKVIKVY